MRHFVLIFLFIATSPLAAQTMDEKTQVCQACHGEQGIPQETTTPIIWGQNAGYIYLQLRDYKKGVRKNESMNAVAEGLEKADMTALADYFSQKPWPKLAAATATGDASVIAQRVNSSIGCTGCHLDHYQGDGSTARLFGQQHDYLASTLAAFRSGARANNPGMTALMNAASEDELKTMADYLAGL